MKRFFLIPLISFLFFSVLTAEPSLEGFLQNDLELKNLALEVKKSVLANKNLSIENGVDITLSTGTANFRFDGDDSSVSFNPSAKISVSQINNLSVSASSKIKLDNGRNNSSDTSVSVSLDLISGFMMERKIALLKSEREVLIAKRNLQNRALEAEKEYYSKLKSLFSAASEISVAQNNLYDDTVDFDEIKAKGYSSFSAKYRQAELKVLSDNHEVETKIHELEHDCAVFASECGIAFQAGTNPADFLPKEIPQTEPIDIFSFQKKFYTKIEEAEYKHKLAAMERDSEKKFSLAATAGYTFKNSNTAFSDNDSEADTIDVGISANYKGISFGAGVYLPTDGENPTYSASASINPNSFRTAKIKKQTDFMNKEQELIAIQSAENDYDTDIVDKQTELEDIKWAKETNLKTYEMYVNLADDMQRLLKQGIVKDTEYLDAFANKELYRFKLLINDIDIIIYNNETKLLFCRDDELKK